MTYDGPVIALLGLGLCLTSCANKRHQIWGPIFNIQLPWLVNAIGINLVILGTICTLTGRPPSALPRRVLLYSTLAHAFFGLYAGAIAARATKQSFKQYATEIGFDYVGLLAIWILMCMLTTV